MMGLCGCADPIEGFRVVFSSPQDGQVVPPTTTVALGFSEAIDRQTCTVGTLHLAALADDGAIAWFEEVSVAESTTGDFRYELVHDELVAELDYVLSVQSGPQGCLSALEEPIEPFSVFFTVEESSF